MNPAHLNLRWMGFLVLCLPALLIVSGTVAGGEGFERAKLPKSLREASGLAVISPSSVVLHNDESSSIYTLNLDSLEVTAKSGNPGYKGDFEGIARVDDQLFLADSSGNLHRFEVLVSEAGEEYELDTRIETGLSEVCEFEGLATVDDLLLLPCKTHFEENSQGTLTVYAYSLEREETFSFLVLDKNNVPGAKKFRPTAIDVNATQLFLISQQQLIVVDRNSHDASVYKLSKKRHPQPEGLAVLDDGRLVIVDDRKNKKSHVTVYDDLHVLKQVR